MKSQIREPMQARSIEKKNRIVDAGYALFEEVGYYNTNTAEIAKRAGVSTGIVYGYFADKKDILALVADRYMTKVTTPLYDMINTSSLRSLPTLVGEFLDYAVVSHRQNAKMHEALHSLRAFDNDINDKFIAFEDGVTKAFSAKLLEFNPNFTSSVEKTHLALNIIQCYSHEYVFDKHLYIDYDILKKLVVDTVCSLFQ